MKGIMEKEGDLPRGFRGMNHPRKKTNFIKEDELFETLGCNAPRNANGAPKRLNGACYEKVRVFYKQALIYLWGQDYDFPFSPAFSREDRLW